MAKVNIFEFIGICLWGVFLLIKTAMPCLEVKLEGKFSKYPKYCFGVIGLDWKAQCVS